MTRFAGRSQLRERGVLLGQHEPIAQVGGALALWLLGVATTMLVRARRS